MRRQLLMILSLGLNLCLIILLLALPRRAKQSANSTTNVIEQTSVSNSVHTQVVVRKQFFLWEELESPDYATYVSNLTYIACPAQTIRDIIVADVNQAFTYRRLTEIKDPLEEWWRSFPDTNLVADSARQRFQLEADRRNLLSGLLGTNWETASLPPQINVYLTGRVLGSVDTDAKRKVLEVLQRSAQQRCSYELSLGLETTAEGRLSGYRLLEGRTRSELQSVLNPSQMEEYLLRYSEAANDLRSGFQDFQVAQNEFQKVFRTVFALREKIVLARADQSTYSNTVNDLESQILQGIRTVVGMKRFQLFRSRTDPIYRNALLAAGDLSNSPRVVQQLYDSLRNFEGASHAIQSNTNLSASERQDKLAALQDQAEQEKDKILETKTIPTEPPPLPVPDAIQPGFQEHRFSPGETIDQIGAQYGVKPADILKANPDLDFNRLQRSAKIRIPVAQP